MSLWKKSAFPENQVEGFTQLEYSRVANTVNFTIFTAFTLDFG